MNDSLRDWLHQWGEWLDALLATGLASMSQPSRARIHAWCAAAELLGFAAQARQARLLLSADLTAQQRHQTFVDLLLEHDMLVRLDAANRLLAVGEGQAIATAEQPGD